MESKNRFVLARTIYNKNGRQSVDAVSKATTVSASMINDLESNVGKPRNVGYQSIVKLALHYGVSCDYLMGLATAATADPDVKQICNYTGLSEQAAKRLHELYSNEDFSVSLKFIDSFLTGNDTEEFELFATWSVLATIIDSKVREQERMHRKEAWNDGEESFIARYNEKLTESRLNESTRLWDEVSGKRPVGGAVEVASGTAAWLYQEHAEDYIEDIFERALYDVRAEIENKYSRKK